MLSPDSSRTPAHPWPGFVDVAAFARDGVDRSVARGASEFLDRRRWLDLPPGAITLAAAQVGAGGERDLVLPGEEFVIVLDGRLTLRQGGVDLELAAREQALLPRGVPLTWSSDVGAKLVVLRHTAGGAPATQRAVKIDTSAALSPSNPPLAELLIGPTPQCRSHADYRSSTGEFVCGTWDSTPYHRRPMLFQHFELMNLLAGSVHFVDSDGAAQTFRAGEIVLFVRGGTVSWESREHVKKAYAWFRPA